MTALTRAITQRHWRQAKLLIEAGSDVNWRGQKNRTPLMEVCFLDNEEKATGLAKMLLESGAKLGLQDNNGLTALSHSILLKRETLFSLFTEFVDIDLNSADFEGNTALFHAVTVGDLKITKSLVGKLKHYGLSVDTFNRKGETPLIRALKLGHLECADVLIDHGNASMEICDMEQHKSARELKKELQQGRKRCIPSAIARLLDQQKVDKKKPRKLRAISSASNSQQGSISLPMIKSPSRGKARPFTAPERILVPDFFKLCTPIQEDLLKLYSIYHQQKTTSYRKGYKPVPFKRLPTLTEKRCENESHEDANKDGGIIDLAQVSHEISVTMKGLAKMNKVKRSQARSTSSSPSQASSGNSEEGAISKLKSSRHWPKPLTKKGIKTVINQNLQARDSPPSPGKSPP